MQDLIEVSLDDGQKILQAQALKPEPALARPDVNLCKRISLLRLNSNSSKTTNPYACVIMSLPFPASTATG